ncbi:MAG: GMC family oxidoreductase N-terminal domain-containing protein, partial [Candidatus Hydrogenedentes bacterium]|nr:GMC family oxidoreductase N-terminal domain-containing protein [Candidatus Hydrogenedentota bacterium]
MSSKSAEVFDAIVVGSGAAGGWAAKELTEGGMSVLVLEAGRPIDEDLDFSPDMNPNIMGMWCRAWYAIRGQHIQARYGSFRRGVSQFFVNDRENPYSVPSGAPFLWYRGRQVGGRMHTWSRAVLRMSDSEFGRPDLDRNEGTFWPISYDDLAPYYDKVERTLGVIGDRDGVENLPDGLFEPVPTVTAANAAFAKLIMDRTGLRVVRNRVVRHNTNRIPLPLGHAMRTGRLVVQPDAVVDRVLIDGSTGNASGVGYFDRLSGNYTEAPARRVVLSASAFESVRILLNSGCPQHPGGIGARSGVLGRYVCDHVMVGKGGYTSTEFSASVEAAAKKNVPHSSDPYDFGVYSMYMPNFCHASENGLGFIGGYGIQCEATNQTWRMLAFGPMAPRFENRITLNPRKNDAWGIPVAHIDIRHRENEINMARHINGAMDRIVRQIGFTSREGGGKFARGPQALMFNLLKRMVLQKSGAFH